MQGWIKLHRKLLASDIFQNEKLLKVFIYCLLKATHSEISQKVGRQTVELKPGQFIYGRKKAALELNMKESTVRDYINILKDDGVITVNPTNKYSIITVVNWDLYQSKEETPDNKYDSNSDNKPTTEGQQKDTNKNVKNDKNEKNNIVVAEQQAQNDEIDILLNRYIQLRGSGFSYSPIDVEAAKHILSSGVPLNSALTYMEELMQSYIPKYPGDKINSLKYCVGYILDRYYKEKAKEGASNVLPINRGSYGRTKSQNKSKPEPILGEDFVGRVPRNRA